MAQEQPEREALLGARQGVYHAWGVTLCFAFPALGGLLFGLDIGSTSLVVNQLSEADTSGVDWYEEAGRGVVKSTLTSASIFGALLGSLIVFPLAHRLGRRRELLAGSMLYGVGAGLSMLAYLFTGSASAGLFCLLVGRVVYGIGIGLSMHAAPSYISEMSPPELRGSLVAAKEGVIVFGVLLGNVVGYCLRDVVAGWRWTYLVQGGIAVVMLAGMVGLPPSSRWLALKGQRDEVYAALRFVYPQRRVELVAEEIMTQVDRVRATVDTSEGFLQKVWRVVSSRQYRPQLICGVGTIALQQITGQPSVLYYTGTIFEDAGIGPWANLLVGAFKLIATGASVLFVDRLGRKQLLLVGNSIMAAALFAVSFAFINYDSSGGITAQKMVILVFLLVYIGGYQVGFGPVAWTLISEVFPLEVRGEAIALAVQTNFFLNLMVTFLFLLELEAIGSIATFAIFALLLVASVVFVIAYVPETKGLSLEEIEAFFNRSAAEDAAATECERLEDHDGSSAVPPAPHVA